jgi:ribosome biogenesis GTPase
MMRTADRDDVAGFAVTLEAWGWDDRWAAELASLDDTSLQPGRVVTRERTRWTVQTAVGPRESRIGRHWSLSQPAVGDWVGLSVADSPDSPAEIRHVLSRRSAFSRRAAGDRSDEQVLAANLDIVWIVHGLDVRPNARRIERHLAMAWESGAKPEIVLTKADAAIALEESLAIVDGLAFGVPVHVVSVVSEPLADTLTSGLEPATTVALLGPSGVGKSSLVNYLVGSDILETADVREGDRKGRHTTVRRQLVPGRRGVLLLDTPGMRELGVWELDRGLEQAFPEIEDAAAGCRFRDCAHESEPGCAVLAAVEDGSIEEARLANYRKLLAEAAFQRRKSDPREQAKAVADYKSIMKSLKHHPKYRRRE